MIRKSKLAERRFYEPGTPFYPFGEEDSVPSAELRVIPYLLSNSFLPAACSFIRNIGAD